MFYVVEFFERECSIHIQITKYKREGSAKRYFDKLDDEHYSFFTKNFGEIWFIKGDKRKFNEYMNELKFRTLYLF